MNTQTDLDAADRPGIQLLKATRVDDTTVRNLAQFYIYEFSRFLTDWQVTYAGRFDEEFLDGLWTRPRRHVYLIDVDGHLAGFAIVDLNRNSVVNDKAGINYIAEFFVMAAFQRRGVGEQAAKMIFNRFPGEWEIAQLEKNVPAQHFWRKVIGQYTDGKFREVRNAEGDVVQIFDNRQRPAS